MFARIRCLLAASSRLGGHMDTTKQHTRKRLMINNGKVAPTMTRALVRLFHVARAIYERVCLSAYFCISTYASRDIFENVFTFIYYHYYVHTHIFIYIYVWVCVCVWYIYISICTRQHKALQHVRRIFIYIMYIFRRIQYFWPSNTVPSVIPICGA